MAPTPYPQHLLAQGFVPVPALAAGLGIAPSTVYRWADAGEVDEVSPGPGRRMVLLSAVVKHLGGIEAFNAAGYGPKLVAAGIDPDLLDDLGVVVAAPTSTA